MLISTECSSQCTLHKLAKGCYGSLMKRYYVLKLKPDIWEVPGGEGGKETGASVWTPLSRLPFISQLNLLTCPEWVDPFLQLSRCLAMKLSSVCCLPLPGKWEARGYTRAGVCRHSYTSCELPAPHRDREHPKDLTDTSPPVVLVTLPIIKKKNKAPKYWGSYLSS